jgi:hypothetical protein
MRPRLWSALALLLEVRLDLKLDRTVRQAGGVPWYGDRIPDRLDHNLRGAC